MSLHSSSRCGSRCDCFVLGFSELLLCSLPRTSHAHTCPACPHKHLPHRTWQTCPMFAVLVLANMAFGPAMDRRKTIARPRNHVHVFVDMLLFVDGSSLDGGCQRLGLGVTFHSCLQFPFECLPRSPRPCWPAPARQTFDMFATSGVVGACRHIQWVWALLVRVVYHSCPEQGGRGKHVGGLPHIAPAMRASRARQTQPAL